MGKIQSNFFSHGKNTFLYDKKGKLNELFSQYLKTEKTDKFSCKETENYFSVGVTDFKNIFLRKKKFIFCVISSEGYILLLFFTDVESTIRVIPIITSLIDNFQTCKLSIFQNLSLIESF